MWLIGSLNDYILGADETDGSSVADAPVMGLQFTTAAADDNVANN